MTFAMYWPAIVFTSPRTAAAVIAEEVFIASLGMSYQKRCRFVKKFTTFRASNSYS